MQCSLHLFGLLLGLAIVALGILTNAQPAPLASCKLQWDFNGIQCDVVSNALVQAIKNLSSEVCPPVGEKCKYTLFSVQKYLLTANHRTPVHNYVDELLFVFNYSGTFSCHVDAFSASEEFLRPNTPDFDDDHGTNYCNLRNLLDETGLTDFVETSNDEICTDYSTANCTVY